MRLIKTLFEHGFTLTQPGFGLRPDIHKILDQGPGEYNEVIEVLDKTVFDALKAIYPDNRLIKEVNEQYRVKTAAINNDGFNTLMPDDTPVQLSMFPEELEPVVEDDQPGKYDELIRRTTMERESEPDPQLTLLSFGGGQDSWAIIYKLIFDPEFRKKYAPHDLVIAMSDTGNEFPYTYKYLQEAIALCKKHGIHFQFITNDQGYHTPGWMNLKDNMRRNNTILGASMGVKACTPSLKIQPVDKYMYAFMCKLYGFENKDLKNSWYDYKARFGTKARVIIGFAHEEEARLAKSIKLHAFLPKWKRENIQYVYPLIEEGWNRADAQRIILQHRDDLPPPSNCMICFYQSDQEILWLWRNYPEEFNEWVELERAKLKKHEGLVTKNYGVYGKITLPQKLEQAKLKYGHWTDEQLWEYKMSHGHCVKSTY